MGNVIKLNKVRRERINARSKALTLCQSGFHKWKPVIGEHFDVKLGKLLTTEQCQGCQIERTILK